MIKAIVLDDELAAGKWLSMKLKETGRVEVFCTLQNPLELTENLNKNHIDVVFLDIEMPEISGIELALQLSMKENAPEIIFVTAYDRYALEAFRADALDYLVKPVIERDLERVLAKLEKRLKSHTNVTERPQPAIEKRCFSISDVNLNFPTAKCEELFLYMLLKNKQSVSKWEIIEDLWPGKGLGKGEANIRTTAFRLNQVLDKQGLDLRVKSTKGYYHFSSVFNKNEVVAVRPFPMTEDLQHIEASAVEILRQHNFLKIMEEKDYLWAIMLKEHESAYYKWAMDLIEHYRDPEPLCLQALCYLQEQFPWKESLLAEILPLMMKLEGAVALRRFFQHQEEERSQTGIKLSQTIQALYDNLLLNSPQYKEKL
ncbi:MAG: hypothetical protein K0R19_2058 [Bacillota bacterium]|jgi:two-component SAPR family response regulator|nr:hypothetical protein [Bacillota bacterium]